MKRKISVFLLFIACLLNVCNVEASAEREPQNAVLFLFCILLAGVLVSYVLQRFVARLPYTVLIFFVGIIISLADGNGLFGTSVAIWENINPEILLSVFLPPLLFNDALHLNNYQVRSFCK